MQKCDTVYTHTHTTWLIVGQFEQHTGGSLTEIIGIIKFLSYSSNQTCALCLATCLSSMFMHSGPKIGAQRRPIVFVQPTHAQIITESISANR